MKLSSFFSIFVLLLVGLNAYPQPAAVTWLEKNKNEKEQRILSLMRVNDQSFYLLRANAQNHAQVVMLNEKGEEVLAKSIPGLAPDGQDVYEQSVSNDSLMLVLYAQWEGNRRTAWYARVFNYLTLRWSAPPALAGSGKTRSTTALSAIQAGIRRSQDGSHTCVYYLQPLSGQWEVNVLMYDAHFGLLWEKSAVLPPQEAGILPRQVFCSNDGAVLIHAQVFSKGASISISTPQQFNGPASNDGSPIFKNDYSAEKGQAASNNAFFVMTNSGADWQSFFPKVMTKYTRSLEISESPKGYILCAGLGGNEEVSAATHYFLYKIDLREPKGEVLKFAELPLSFRKAYLNENRAKDKAPVEQVFVRKIIWEQQTPWILTEYEDFSTAQLWVKEAALVKIDSTWKMSTVVPVNKSHKLTASLPGSESTAAVLPAPKGGWWLMHQTGVGTEATVTLTPSKGKESFELSPARQSGVAAQWHTLYPYQGRWWLVGLSGDLRSYRIGHITPAAKKRE